MLPKTNYQQCLHSEFSHDPVIIPPCLPILHMMDSATVKAFQQVLRLDRTNWETWSFSIKAAFHFLNTLGIAEGTETCSSDAVKTEDYDK